MDTRTIQKKEYLKAGQCFHWATVDHYKTWFTGRSGRHKRTETILPRLVQAGKLRALRYGKKLVYSVPRRTRKKLENHFYGDKETLKKHGDQIALEIYRVDHGLACTEGLVRFWRSKMEGIIIPEKYFRSINGGSSGLPEWGIIYPNGSMLLYEHCTADNFYRPRHVERKVIRYQENIYTLEKHFKKKAIFVFVLDVPRLMVERFVKTLLPIGNQFFFTNYDSFLCVPIDKQLVTPIYIWGEDGKSYSLVNENA